MAFAKVSLICILLISSFIVSYGGGELRVIRNCISSILGLAVSLLSPKNSCIEDFKDVSESCGFGNSSPASLFEPTNGQPIIFPGTKYCGPYNISKDGELGYCKTTDACCKLHDSCAYGILPGETKYGLTNNGNSVSYNCSCDEELRDCLEAANTVIGEFFGIVYFTVRNAPCFTEDYPIVGCNKSITVGCFSRCLEYVRNTSRPKEIQFVDQKGWDISHLPLFLLSNPVSAILHFVNITKGDC